MPPDTLEEQEHGRPDTELRLGGQVFVIKKVLGRGGMAEVCLAVRKGPADFARKVVVKKILPERSADPEYVERFIREASLAAMLHHPNIVEVLELGNIDDDYYIVMEYVDGANLQEINEQLQEQEQRLPVAVAMRVAADVAGALHYAHTFVGDDGVKRRIVHRDVSAGNIMITSTGQVKLVDFGIAKDIDGESLTVGLGFIGKPLYMTPEAVAGDEATPLWDVYALGMVLYIALAGHSPDNWASRAGGMAAFVHDVVTKMPTPIRRLNPDVPAALEEIIMGCLAKRPEARPDSAATLQAKLEEVLASSSPVTATTLAALVAGVRSGLRPGPGPSAPDSTLLDGPRPLDRPPDLVAVVDAPTKVGLRPKVAIGLGALALLVTLVVGASRCEPVRAWLGMRPGWKPPLVDTVPHAVGVPAAPEAGSATLKIVCSSWGWVTLDGRRVGICPIPSMRVSPGAHVVGLEDSTSLRTREIQAEPDKTVTVTFGPGRR
jgi:serine/threonine protein kinase